MSTVYVNRYTKARELMEKNGGPSSFAKRMGVTKQYISHILAEGVGRKQMGSRFARKVETEFSLPIGYLDFQDDNSGEIDHSSLVVIKMNNLSRLGEVAKPSSSIYKIEAFRDWLVTHLNVASFNNLSLHAMLGNSMSPTIEDGATLIMDTSESSINRDGIYVIQVDEQVFVRRVDRGVDGSLRLVPDNAQYKEQIIPREHRESVVVCGRVAYSLDGRRIS